VSARTWSLISHGDSRTSVDREHQTGWPTKASLVRYVRRFLGLAVARDGSVYAASRRKRCADAIGTIERSPAPCGHCKGKGENRWGDVCGQCDGLGEVTP
jgi:hypothetical protein